MKTIVVAGSRSNVGKTSLARAICGLLPGAALIKIGHGAAKPRGNGFFYHVGTPLSTIMTQHSPARYLIIESNSILNELQADCVIFLAADNPKPSAALAREKADIVRGELVTDIAIREIAGRLSAGVETVRNIALLAGALTEGIIVHAAPV